MGLATLLTIVPRHSVLLDKSGCPPAPPPSLSTQTCAALYEIAARSDPPLLCDLDDAATCASLSCVLTLDARYVVRIRPQSCAEKPSLLSTVTTEGGEELFSSSDDAVDPSFYKSDVALPMERAPTSLSLAVASSDANARLNVSATPPVSVNGRLIN